jgi:competence protein ComGC
VPRWRNYPLFGVVSVAIIAALLYFPMQEARRAVVESGQRSLLLQIEQRLTAYNVEHERYPESLSDMKFTYHDGADADTLKRIEYHTDGQYYRLVTPSDFDGREISVCK